MATIKLSILQKTMVTLVVLFGIIAMTVSFFTGHNLKTHLTEDAISKATALVKNIAANSIEILLYRDISTIQSIVDGYLEIEGVDYVFVQSSDHQVIAHTFTPQMPSQLLTLFSTKTLPGDQIAPAVFMTKFQSDNKRRFIDISSPILDGELGSVHVGMDEALIDQKISATVMNQVVMIFIVFLLSLAVAYFAVLTISEPLRRLQSYAHLLAGHDFEKALLTEKEEGHLTSVSTREVSALATSFVTLEKMIIRYIQNLKETTSQKERIESELEIARSIQMNILPKIEPAILEASGLDIFAFVQPAKHVGGDFFDFFMVSPKKFGFCIADVSGKGVPAALLMAVTKILLKTVALHTPDPQVVLSHVNNELCQDNDAMMFVTTFYGLIDLESLVLTYSVGGHNLPYLIRDQQVVPFESTDGLALGVMEGASFGVQTISLKAGDKLFLYTDGVTEAFNGHQDLFSDAKLADTLAVQPNTDAKSFSLSIGAAVTTFVDGADPSDDITIFTIGV